MAAKEAIKILTCQGTGGFASGAKAVADAFEAEFAKQGVEAKVGNRLPPGLVFVPYHFENSGITRIYQGEAVIAVELSK